MSKPQDTTSESLLEKALKFKEPTPTPQRVDPELYQQIELAIAYHENRIYSGAVASVMGLQGKAVSAWFASVVMKGIRAGIVEIKIKDKSL